MEKKEAAKKFKNWQIIVLGVLFFAFLPIIIGLLIIALPFLTIGYISNQIKEISITRNSDKLRAKAQLKHKLMTDEKHLKFLYQLEKLRNEKSF